MKAVLISRRAGAPKIHDLARLSSLITAVRPDWSLPTPELATLTRGAVQLRYDAVVVTSEMAVKMLDTCERIREPLLALISD